MAIKDFNVYTDDKPSSEPLEYGSIQIKSDGTVLAGNTSDQPVELAKQSQITTFTGTATLSSNIVDITVSNGSTASYTVTFTAPSDFVAENTYRVNGVAVALTDLNNKPLKNAWVSGSPVTLSVVGSKAFFKAGGEFSSGDLLPKNRVEAVYSQDNTNAEPTIKYFSEVDQVDNYKDDYYGISRYSGNHIYKLNSTFTKAISQASLPSYFTNSTKTILVSRNHIFVYSDGWGRWVVLNKDLQIIQEKTFSGYYFRQNIITECDGNLYVYSDLSSVEKILKIDYSLNIVKEIMLDPLYTFNALTSFDKHIYMISGTSSLKKINIETDVITNLSTKATYLTNKSKYAINFTQTTSSGSIDVVDLQNDRVLVTFSTSRTSFTERVVYWNDNYIYHMYGMQYVLIYNMAGNNSQLVNFWIQNASNVTTGMSNSPAKIGFINSLGIAPMAVKTPYDNYLSSIRMLGIEYYKIIEE